ncbi:pyrazinamidase/nicotinamidase-like protein [Phyllosticta capitalensis]|uniref:nicotinamidase n=1 Tax=Phyllosticta capitalensis TaxID=121624 RepID=A0ABR1YWK5_9PEZI
MANGARDTHTPFVPALIVVDVQEDFCPPNGALAVPTGRAVAAPINTLLTLPFALKIATKDFHPPSHISFASNHAAPDNVPFASSVTIVNPLNAAETYSTRLWPVHCVQGTPGAQLIPELDTARLDGVVEKGMDARVEMYSAFADPFRAPCVASSSLEQRLRDRGVTDVFVVGLAMDYCVRYTAEDAVERGWRTWVVEEGTRAVDAGNWDGVQREMEGRGISFVKMDGEEVGRVRALEAEGAQKVKSD